MKVFVTGMGVMNSIGNNLEEFTKSLQSEVNGISYADYLQSLMGKKVLGGIIQDFCFEKLIKQNIFLDNTILQRAQKCAKRSTFTIQSSVIAGLEAWANANLYKAELDYERIGLIVAGQNIAQMYHYDMYQKYSNNLDYLNPTYALHYMDTDCVGTLSEIFNIRGESFSIGGASATSNVGIIKGYQQIHYGMNDICMIVAPVTHLSPLEIQGFNNIGAMGGKRFIDDPEKSSRPFDKEHEGFIYGQGVGVLILESEESVRKRNVQPMVEILGGSILLDANRLSMPNEDGEAAVIKKAIKSAGLTYKDITYINAHGSSSPLGDEIETKVIKRVFHESLSNIYINSTKGFIGHCINSAAIIETIAIIIQMKEKFIHTNLNLDNPIDADLGFVRSTLHNTQVKYAIKNSFGFGGINSCLVLKNI